jgi:hypothetical protein
MFFLSLLLFGQSAGLDANAGKAAGQCLTIYATDLARGPHIDPARSVSQITYLAMVASRAEGLTGAPFLDRAVAVLDELKPALAAGSVVPVAPPADCDKRFPLARATAPAPLPQNLADRDILCFSALSLVASALEDAPERSAELAPVIERFAGRLDAALKAKGVGADKEEIALGDAMLGSLDIGNADTIAQSCRKLPG